MEVLGGDDGFVVILDVKLILLSRIVMPGKPVIGIGLLAQDITDVLFIGKDSSDSGTRPVIAKRWLDAICIETLCHRRRTGSGKRFPENALDDQGLLRIGNERLAVIIKPVRY